MASHTHWILSVVLGPVNTKPLINGAELISEGGEGGDSFRP